MSKPSDADVEDAVKHVLLGGCPTCGGTMQGYGLHRACPTCTRRAQEDAQARWIRDHIVTRDGGFIGCRICGSLIMARAGDVDGIAAHYRFHRTLRQHAHTDKVLR